MVTEPLPFEVNAFGGVTILPAALELPDMAFNEALRHSLDAWAAQGYKLAWLKIGLERAALIPLAAEQGFAFHHSDETSLMMTRRLQPQAFVPAYATHYVGAGGVALNERQELLVVCELHRRGNRPYYKLPGGALQAGEHLADAVVREVLEETGVSTRFVSLACLRHWHGYRDGKSDIYFVCRLEPLSQAIQRQVEEIEECLWMPLADYMASDLVSAFNKQIVQAAVGTPGLAIAEITGYGPRERYEFFMPHDD